MDRWVAAGVPQQRAVDLVLFKELGILPSGVAQQGLPKASINESVLFSGSASDCDMLEKSRFGSPELRRGSFAGVGGLWAEAARRSAGLPAAKMDRLLEAAYTLSCVDGDHQ